MKTKLLNEKLTLNKQTLSRLNGGQGDDPEEPAPASETSCACPTDKCPTFSIRSKCV